MFVTAHAYNRIMDRLGANVGGRVAAALEALPGHSGTCAYIVGTFPRKMESADGSNGDTLVAIAVEGSIETVFFRRSSQDMSAEFFGADWVEDIRDERRPVCALPQVPHGQ